MKHIFALMIACLALVGCGLHPLYAPSGGFAKLQNKVDIMPIPGKDGYLVYSELVDRLGEVPAGQDATYRLQVVLDDDISGFGVRGDDSIVRERRVLRARYRLFDNQSGAIITDATAGSDAGIDVVSSEYATIAAEDSALENLSDVVAEQIVAELGIALEARHNAAADESAE